MTDTEHWDGDHTALVRLLRHVRADGLTLDQDAAEIATRIICSQWLAANRARVFRTTLDREDAS